MPENNQMQEYGVASRMFKSLNQNVSKLTFVALQARVQKLNDQHARGR